MQQMATTKNILGIAAKILFALMVTVVVSSCGADREFRIDGRIDGFGTGNLKLVYYNGDGVQTMAATAVDGRFMANGRLNDPAFFRIYTNNGIVVGRFIVAPGDIIEADFNLSDPTNMRIEGNDDSKRLAKFIKENAALIKGKDTKSLNAAIAKYVAANPKHAVSGALLADFFDSNGHEAEALELINLLEREARNTADLEWLRNMLMPLTIPTDSITLSPIRLFGPGDSLSTIDPADSRLTLITLTNASLRSSDSITTTIGIISAGKSRDELQIADISCDPDTATWKKSIRESDNPGTPSKNGSPTNMKEITRRFWSLSPYNIKEFDRMPVRRLPWFVVADSTGQVLYRGSSVSEMRKVSENAMNKK